MLQCAFFGIINDTLKNILFSILNVHFLKTNTMHFCEQDAAVVTLGILLVFSGKSGHCVRAHALFFTSSLFVNGPCPLCPRRKSNWIADRMKKLIKPRGGGREGRALFTAAGSVENLADSTEFTSDTHTPQPGETTNTHKHFLIHTNTSRLVFTKICSHIHPIKRGYRHAYKSSHDYQVWSALIPLSSP